MLWTSPEFNAALQLETTFLSVGVRVTLASGQVLAWTTLRRQVALPQLVIPIRAASGARPAQNVVIPATLYDHRAALRLTSAQTSDDITQADNMEMTLGLGASLDPALVRAGALDNRPFDVLVFDWKTPAGADGGARAMLRLRGELGQRTIRGADVTWKLRSLADRLKGDVLEATSRDGRARWGDPELAFFDLTGRTSDGFPAQLQTTVAAVDPLWLRRRFKLNAPFYPDNRFADGTVWFSSGANAAFSCGVLMHEPGTNWFTTMRQIPAALHVGDALSLRIRAPRTIEEWRTFFGTGFRFAGEPAIPSLESSNRIID